MALNFPPNPTEGQTHFDPSNGVTYTYKNGGWVASGGTQDDLDLRYVLVAGDNMTGDLTLGTDKITLKAANGSIEAADSLYLYNNSSSVTVGTVNSYKLDPYTYRLNCAAQMTYGATGSIKGLSIGASNTDAVNISKYYRFGLVYKNPSQLILTGNSKDKGVDDELISFDGNSVKIGGTLPSAPNILLNAANGNIMTTGSVKATRTGAPIYIGIDGSDTTSNTFIVMSTGDIYANGNVEIGGKIATNTVTNRPNITLAADGSINAARLTAGDLDVTVDSGKEQGVYITSSGYVAASRVEDRATFVGYTTGNDTATWQVLGSGYTQQAGDARIGITGSFTPSTPAISLNAADGSAEFASTIFGNADANGKTVLRGYYSDGTQGLRIGYQQTNPSGEMESALFSTSSTKTIRFLHESGAAEFTGDIESTSQNGGQLAGFRNQIINGDFRFWQRGIDFTAGSSGYCADRFYFSNASTPVQAKLTTTNLPVGFSYAIQLNDTTVAIQQAIELFRAGQNNQFAKGSTWTMSVWSTIDLSSTPARLDWKTNIAATGTRAHAAVNYASTGETSGDFTRYAATVIINSDAPAGSTMLSMVLTSASFKRFTGFQVEPGPVATPFEHRPIGTELALCQRYYQNLGRAVVQYANSSSNNFRDFICPYQTVPIRETAPTALGADQVWHTNNTNSSSNVNRYDIASVNIITGGVVQVRCHRDAVQTAGTIDVQAIWRMSSGSLAIDAEL